MSWKDCKIHAIITFAFPVIGTQTYISNKECVLKLNWTLIPKHSDNAQKKVISPLRSITALHPANKRGQRTNSGVKRGTQSHRCPLRTALLPSSMRGSQTFTSRIVSGASALFNDPFL